MAQNGVGGNETTRDMNETVLNNVILEVISSTPVRQQIDALAMVNVAGKLTSILGGDDLLKIVNPTMSKSIDLMPEFKGVQTILNLNETM